HPLRAAWRARGQRVHHRLAAAGGADPVGAFHHHRHDPIRRPHFLGAARSQRTACAPDRDGADRRSAVPVRAADGTRRLGHGLPADHRRSAACPAGLCPGRAFGATDDSVRTGGKLMTRWLPFPRISALLLVTWLLFNQSLAPAHILLGALLAVSLPWLLARLQPVPGRPRHPLTILRLAMRVLLDIIRSNIAVALIILRPGMRGRTAGFVRI